MVVKASQKGKTLLVLLAVVIMNVFLLEIFLRFTNLEDNLLTKSLYYQMADTESHQVSEDVNKLYELKPNSKEVYFSEIHPKETKYKDRIVTINSLGFRGEEKNRDKPENVFRIFVLGGSNTYGISVSDNDTYPAIMQKILDEKYPGKFEVWNAGVCAYVLSQKIAYAESIIKEFDPDLLIIQIHNSGRRAFLWDTAQEDPKRTTNVNKKNVELLRKNNELYLENIPLFSENPTLKAIHPYLVRNFAFYRLISISVNQIRVNHYFDLVNQTCYLGSPDTADFVSNFYVYNERCESELLGTYLRKSNIVGDLINKREFDRFIKTHNKTKKVIFDPVLQYNFCDVENCLEQFQLPPSYTMNPYETYNLECYFLCGDNGLEEYRNIHPPSYVYEWYAEKIVNFLLEKDLIPNE